ncbi:pyruvate formate lyase activating enzyme [Allochromatium warmingii]|uniref:Pyruvate formate lyase activating enzyme n=1 Tax=Allochromatium warmingii TaxID=61595 RepID=A0A1H3HEV3_ALLWA|nr:anaerobic ribonucleoside-triphosphate reductase activating protein [Allochromatium warmingii]SDY13378.1 pyruvate formate lyase activating enzyme [Allochromatium warmingii]
MLDRIPTAAPDSLQIADRLRIGGLTRLTTIDYPGELAAVVFCQGCAWRCRYCQNGDLLEAAASEQLIAWADLHAFLRQRVGLLDAVVFSGGEPTLQTALGAAMIELRVLGYKIGLHTNGAYPERLHQLLPLIDWIGLDIKALPEEYPALTGGPHSGEQAWASLALLVASGVKLEVRTTLMPDWTPDYLRTLSHELAAHGVQHYALQVCATQRALDPKLPSYAVTPRELVTAVDASCFERLEIRGL